MRLFRAKIEHLDRYVSQKHYARAVEAIDGELEKDPGNLSLLQRRAEILDRAADEEAAIAAHRALAQAYVREGLHARAVALYKKIVASHPEREELGRELAALIGEESQRAPWGDFTTPLPRGEPPRRGATLAVSRGEGTLEVVVQPGAEVAKEAEESLPTAAARAEPEEGLLEPEEGLLEPEEGLLEPEEGLLEPEEAASEPKGLELGGQVAPEGEPAVSLEDTPSEEPVFGEPWSPGEGDAGAKERETSSLFARFDRGTLEEVLSSTSLRSFHAGDIIVSEGEAGASLFFLIEGRVKVYTRSPLGAHLPLTELGPGDVFGEVSVLTGNPRTATITAMSRVLAIEVSKEMLDEIARDHPSVKEVLRQFCEERAQSTIEALIRFRRSGGA